MTKTGPRHKSTWHICDVCHEEFLAVTARICPDCRKQEANRSYGYHRRNKQREDGLTSYRQQ